MSNPEDLIDWKSVSSLSAAIPQRKAAVTRACTKVTKLVARPYNFSSPSQVENAQKELEQALALLQKITYRISDISPEHVSGGLKSLEEYEEKYEEALDKLAAYINDNSGPNHDSNKTVRVDKLLFPDPLLQSATPEEFRLWKGTFERFIASGNVDKAPPATQQAYLFRCLSPELQKTLAPKINEATPVSGANGCLQILESEFHLLHPTFTRRMEFFQATRAPQEDLASCLDRLDSLQLEADIESLDHGGITVFKFLAICGDDDLRKKIFDSKVDTLPHIKEIVRQHTAQLRSIESIREQRQVVAPVSRANPKPRIQPERSPRANPQGRTNPGPEKAGLCGRCGRAKHKEGDVCFVVTNNLCCDKCGRAGHIAPACRSGGCKRQGGRNIRAITDAHHSSREEER